MGKRNIEPFTSDIEYFEKEFSWIEARCHRIGATSRLERTKNNTDDYDDYAYQDTKKLKSSAKLWTKREKTLRKEIDERLKFTRIQAEKGSAQELSLDRYCRVFELNEEERTALLLSASVCITNDAERCFGALSGYPDSNMPLTVEVFFNFLELSFGERIVKRKLFSHSSPLGRHELVNVDMYNRYIHPQDLLHAQLRIDARVLNDVLGDQGINDELAEFSSLEDPLATIDRVVLKPSDKKRIISVVENHDRYLEYRQKWGIDPIIRYGRGILMLFHGPSGTGKTMMAHAVADHLGKRILNVDLSVFFDMRQEGRFLPALFREARNRDAILFFDECETLFQSRAQGNFLMTMLLSEIERFEGVAILATNLSEQLDEALMRRLLIKVHFPQPDAASRAEIWRKHLPEQVPLAPDVDLEAIAQKCETTGGLIKNAVLMAVAQAVHESQEPRIEQRHLEEAIADQLWENDRPSKETLP